MSVFNDARTVRRAVCENDWIESKQRTYSACAQRKAKSSAIEPLMRKIGRRSPQSSSAPVARSFIHAPRGLKELRAGRRRFSAPAEKSACRKAFSGRRVGYAARKIRGISRASTESASAPTQIKSALVQPRAARTAKAQSKASVLFSYPKISACPNSLHPSGFQESPSHMRGTHYSQNRQHVLPKGNSARGQRMHGHG